MLVMPPLLPEHLDPVEQVAALTPHVVLQLIQVSHQTIFAGYSPPDIFNLVSQI